MEAFFDSYLCIKQKSSRSEGLTQTSSANCATTGSSERPRPAIGGIGYAVLMEVKGVNGIIMLNSGTLSTIQE